MTAGKTNIEKGSGDPARAVSNLLLGKFLLSASVIFFITGAAKIWTGFGNVKILLTIDPVTGMEFRHLLITVGIIELVIACLCLFRRFQGWALGLVTWLSTIFIIYRLGLSWMEWKRPCGCLGSFTDALGLNPQHVDIAMRIILIYLFSGSLLLLLWRCRRDCIRIFLGREAVME